MLGVVALGAALVLAMRAPELPLLLPIAVVMTTLAWGYSAPPLRLAARGLGEITTAVVVTLCVPLLGYYLQAGELHPRIFAACLLPCVLQFAMLLAIELPDAAGDAVAGKRTLVVRLGAAAGARMYAALTIAGFGALPLLAAAGRAAGARGDRAAGAGADRDLAGGARRPRRLRRSGALGQRRVLVGGAARRQRGDRAGRGRHARVRRRAAESRRRRRCRAARASERGAARMPSIVGQRERGAVDEEHQRARQPVVRAQQAPALAIEAGERAHRPRPARAGTIAASRSAVTSACAMPPAVSGSVARAASPSSTAPGANPARARRVTGARPASFVSGVAPSSQSRSSGCSPIQRVHRVARVRPERVAIAERREQQLAVGKRRRVQLVTAADEDLQARRLLPAGREAIVHAHADAPGFAGPPAAIEPERAAHRRIEAVRADHQSAAAQLAADVEADRASPRDRGAFDRRVLEHAHAGRRPRRREQRLVQMQAPLRERERAPSRPAPIGKPASAVSPKPW